MTICEAFSEGWKAEVVEENLLGLVVSPFPTNHLTLHLFVLFANCATAFVYYATAVVYGVTVIVSSVALLCKRIEPTA